MFHFINHVQVLMVCFPSTIQAAKFSWAKNISSYVHCNDSTNLLSLATSANAYLMSIPSFVNAGEYRQNIPTFLWDYSHIVPLNQIEVTSEPWTSNSTILLSGFRSWLCNIYTLFDGLAYNTCGYFVSCVVFLRAPQERGKVRVMSKMSVRIIC